MSTVTTYTVSGMTCGHCVAAVTEEVTRLPGVVGVDVDLASGRLDVTSDTALDDTSVENAVQEAGYELASS